MVRVAEVYDDDPEYEWQRLQRHRTEFAVTMRALEDHLPSPPATVLDVGGGPGRYAIALTQRGYRVTLLDLARGNLDLARTKAREAGVELTAVLHSDARQLPFSSHSPYDALLLMGPLYHLLPAEARHQALSEAKRVLKPAGVFITRFAPVRDIAIDQPEWILQHRQRFQQLLEEGRHPASADGGRPDFYFAHPDEIVPLMEGHNFETLALVGVEGVVAGHEEKVNALEGELWQAWVELNYRLGREPTLYGAADHLLYVGRRT